MKGLLDIAEGYLHKEDEDAEGREGLPIKRSSVLEEQASPVNIATSSPASSSTSAASSAFSQMSIVQIKLVEVVDVPSGWIHLQSTYLDGTGGERKIRSFGLKNVGQEAVQVEIGSDLGTQLVFWKSEDEKGMSPFYLSEMKC